MSESVASSSRRELAIRVLVGVVAIAVIGYAFRTWYFNSPVRVLAKAIRSGDPEDRIVAFRKLPQTVENWVDADFAIPLLLEGLKDPSVAVREESAMGLGTLFNNLQLGGRGSEGKDAAILSHRDEVRRALEAVLSDPDVAIRQVALGAFISCGVEDEKSPIPPAVRAMLVDPNEAIRLVGLRAIPAYDSGLDELLPIAIRTFASETPAVKEAILQQLGRPESEARQKVVPVTSIGARPAPNPAEREIEPPSYRPRHVPLLVEMLDHPDLRLRYAATRGLWLLGVEAKAARPALIRLLRAELARSNQGASPDGNVQSDPLGSGMHSLVAITPEDDPAPDVVEVLREILNTSRRRMTARDAAEALAYLGPQLAAPAVPEILKRFEECPAGAPERNMLALAMAHLARGTKAQPAIIEALARAWMQKPIQTQNHGVHEALMMLRPDSERVLPEVRDFKRIGGSSGASFDRADYATKPVG